MSHAFVGEVEKWDEVGEEVVEFGAAGGKVQVDVDSAEVRGEGAFEVGGAGA